MIIELPDNRLDVPANGTEFPSVWAKVVATLVVMEVGYTISAGTKETYFVQIKRVGKNNYTITGIARGETQTHTNLPADSAFMMFASLFPIVWNRHDPEFLKGNNHAT